MAHLGSALGVRPPKPSPMMVIVGPREEVELELPRIRTLSTAGVYRMLVPMELRSMCSPEEAHVPLRPVPVLVLCW